MDKITDLPPEHISKIIQIALSDHVSFNDIQAEYGISDKQVKTLMRDTLSQIQAPTFADCPPVIT